MSNQITNYVCPACGGPLHFSESTGKVVCDYCDSAYDIQYIEQYYAEKDAKAAEAKAASDEKGEAPSEAEWNSVSNEDWGEDGKKLKLYSCPSCRAQLVCDDTTGASSCPYCGNPTIVPGTFSGMLKPDYVIPFAIGKDAAVAQLKAFYKKKPFLPRAFTAENHIDEIKGLYVPFWLFSGTAKADVRFHATMVSHQSTPREDITHTDHYDVQRSGSVRFDKIPADGSSKMPDDYMDAIEPYDYSKLVPFSTAYLPGFLADKYDVTSEDCSVRAGNRARHSAVDAMQSDVGGYSSCSIAGSSVDLQDGKTEYALLPVWVLHTKYKGENFLYTVNGQTGKMAGKLPTDKGRMALYFAGITAAASAVITALAMMFFV